MKNRKWVLVLVVFLVGLVCFAFVCFDFFDGCDNERPVYTNIVKNFDNRDRYDIFLKKGETYKVDFLGQFKASGISITKINTLSTNTDVFTIKGDTITATGMGQARLRVELYSKEKNTYYTETSAYIYVTDLNNENLIEIKSAQDLSDIRKNSKGNFILKNDIDLLSWGNWVPINNAYATSEPENHFSGTFINPTGYRIKNLTVTQVEPGINGGGNGGLFNRLTNAYIDGLILEKVFIDLANFESTLNSSAGGIASSSMSSAIRNCSIEGTIIAQGMVGGIVSGSSWGSVFGSSFKGIAKSTKETAAGIAAYGYIVKDSRVEATIEAPFAAGGIMGSAPAGYHIENCTFKGELLGGKHNSELIAYPTTTFISS